MRDITRIAGELIVIMIVAFPPFMYLFRYINGRVKSVFLRLILYAAYWGGTLLFSNTIPAVTVLFLIWKARVENNELARDSESNAFVLDCTGPKWKFSFKDFVKIFLLGILLKAIVTYINLLVILLLSEFKIDLKNQEIIGLFFKSSFLGTVIYFIIIVIFAPVVEEFVFRFWIYDRLLKHRIGPWFAMLLSSLLFMTAHFNLQGAAAFFLIGAANCYLYEKKGYWAAVTNHFVFNLISALMLLAARALNLPI